LVLEGALIWEERLGSVPGVDLYRIIERGLDNLERPRLTIYARYGLAAVFLESWVRVAPLTFSGASNGDRVNICVSATAERRGRRFDGAGP
jgi:hypothetical protein